MLPQAPFAILCLADVDMAALALEHVDVYHSFSLTVIGFELFGGGFHLSLSMNRPGIAGVITSSYSSVSATVLTMTQMSYRGATQPISLAGMANILSLGKISL